MGQHSTTLYKADPLSPLHRLHPFTKLSYVFGVAVFVYGDKSVLTPTIVFLALNAVFNLACTLSIHSWRIIWPVILPVSLFMVGIHGIFSPENKTVLLSWEGIILYREGVFFALHTVLQLVVILSSSLLFVFTTHPADLIVALTQAGWSQGFAYLLGSPLLMIDQMRMRAINIQGAQRARGLVTDENIFSRIKGIAPLVIPFVLGVFMEMEQRATALEIRGFNSPGRKSHWRRLPDSDLQRVLRWCFFILGLLYLTYLLFAHILD